MIKIDNHKGHEDRHCRVLFADGGLREVEALLAKKDYKEGSSGSTKGDPTFYGTNTLTEALDMARKGWSHGASMVRNKMPAPNFPNNGRQAKHRFEVAGSRPDVGRYLAGDPRNMVVKGIDHSRGKVLSIYIACGIRANISIEQQQNYGVAICEMVYAVEATGKRIELNQITRAPFREYDNGKNRYKKEVNLITGWRVKNAGDMLDVAAVAFTYGHVAAHRRLQFLMRANLGVDGGKTPSGGIMPADFPGCGTALVLDALSDHEERALTVEDARLFVAEEVNRAIGYQLIDLAPLQKDKDEAEAKLKAERMKRYGY